MQQSQGWVRFVQSNKTKTNTALITILTLSHPFKMLAILMNWCIFKEYYPPCMSYYSHLIDYGLSLCNIIEMCLTKQQTQKFPNSQVNAKMVLIKIRHKHSYVYENQRNLFGASTLQRERLNAARHHVHAIKTN